MKNLWNKAVGLQAYELFRLCVQNSTN